MDLQNQLELAGVPGGAGAGVSLQLGAHTRPSDGPSREGLIEQREKNEKNNTFIEAFRALLSIMISGKICQDGGAPASPPGPQRSRKRTVKPLSTAL